ncbi:MAG TPA: outer membrane lipoprotein-sorting protein [Fibrobacteria bacterium]|nr:outer membrane lipoprotein-sorting protein [Fibrobacteria bacterium]
MKTRAGALALTGFFWGAAFAADRIPTGSEMLSRIEANTRLASDISATVTLTQRKSGQGVKTMDMLFYRRDADNSFLIVITGPEADKGNGYLRSGDNFWMYRRNTRSFQHINRDENIAGTDAQGDDFGDRKLTELYRPALDPQGRERTAEDTLGKVPVFRLEAVAKVFDVDYPRKTYWVRRDNGLVLKEQSFAQSGALMQTAYYLKYAPILGRFVPVEQMFIDEFEKGNRTRLGISGIVTAPLAADVFTKAYLENLAK